MKEEILHEKFGDFLKKVGGFLTGARDEPPASQASAFTAGRAEGTSDPVADSYSAEALKSSLLVTYSKLDQILEAIKRMNPDDVQGAKSEISGIISFIQTSYKKVVQIIEDARNIPAGERARTLNDVAKKLNGYIIGGGAIDKWKEKWLGKFNSKIGGYEFYKKGKSLVQKGNEILAEVQRTKTLQDEIKQTELMNALSRAKKSVTGEADDLPPKPPKPGSEKSGEEKETATSSKKPTKPTKLVKDDPASVKLLRQRLAKIGVTKTGTTDAFSEKEDSAAIKTGMQYLGTVSGKQYGNTDSDIQEFFKDLGIFVKNRASVIK